MKEQINDVISNVVESSKKNLDTMKRLANRIEEIQDKKKKEEEEEDRSFSLCGEFGPIEAATTP